MFVEKFDNAKWRSVGFRQPKIGEYILCYDQNWQRIISQVDNSIDKRCFVMERIGEVK